MFRGNIVHEGLSEKPQASDEAFAGGWFPFGRPAHASRRLHPAQGRSKDIKSFPAGENISSIEVEDALYKHPAVALLRALSRGPTTSGASALGLLSS